MKRIAKLTGGKRNMVISAVLVLVIVLIAGVVIVMKNAASDPEVGAATGKSALAAMKDICGDSYVETLADLKEAGKVEAPEEYLMENSVFVMDEAAVDKYVETYISGAESSAQASGVSTDAYIRDTLGYESIEKYRAAAKAEAEGFIKKRLAVYEAAKKKNIRISEKDYQELVSAYAATYGYSSVEEFTYACVPASIANEMLFDKTVAELKKN